MTGRFLVTGIVVLAVGLAGCDSTGDAASAPTGSPSSAAGSASATTTPTVRPSSPPSTVSAPLTGAPVSAAISSRAAVAVALRATSGPSETSGLGAADVVYEEFAGTSSRHVAIFQSRDPKPVGPVGPTIPLDRKVTTVFGGVLAYSGGTAKFVKMLDKAPTATVNALASPTAFTRSGSSTFAEVPSLRAGATKATRPKTIFSFAETAGPSASVPPSKVSTAVVSLSSGAREEWTHTADSLWRRTAAGKVLRTADGGTIAVANLVFQLTPYQKVYLKSSSGPVVLTADVLGTGPATVCAATGCIAGSWQRRGYEASTNYYDSRRSAVRLSKGSTWVLLAPTGSTLTLR